MSSFDTPTFSDLENELSLTPAAIVPSTSESATKPLSTGRIVLVGGARGTPSLSESRPSQSEALSFTTKLNRVEVTTPYAGFAAWPDADDDLRARVSRFEQSTQAELRRLALAVDQLRVLVQTRHFQPPSDDETPTGPARSHALTVDDLDAAVSASDRSLLIALLNMVGDEEVPVIGDVASRLETYLKVDDPKVRAAAGRAMSAAVGGDYARATISTALKVEPNRFVASILRSAIDSL